MNLSNEIKHFYSENFDFYNSLFCNPQELISKNAWILIHAVHSTVDIRGVVQDDFNQRFASIQSASMDKYYQENPPCATYIVENSHYALFDSEWFRVKCTKCNYRTQMAEVYFIDRGDFDEYPFSFLYDLYDFFYLFPPRVVKISIKDLEDYADFPEVGDILSNLLIEKNVYIKVKNILTSTDDIFTLVSDVYLMKQNGSKLNVISLLLDKIHKSDLNPNVIVGSTEIMHCQAFIPQFVRISCVKEKEVYIQLNSSSACYFNRLMSSAAKKLENTKNLEPIMTFDRAETYIVKDPADGKLYRVKIINIKSFDEAEVMCIDFGKTFCVSKKDLILLENVSKSLAWFPEQAVQVILHGIDPKMFDKNMVAQLARLAPQMQQLVLKVIENTNEIPVVKLFTKRENDCFKCINEELLANSTKPIS